MVAFVILVLVALLAVQIWLVAAFSYALLQTRERLLWLQIVASAIMLGTFLFISLSLLNQQQPNAGIVLVCLGLVMVLTTAWRRFSVRTELHRSYPRGIGDMMRFRRPVADLKRRVRTK